MASPRIVPTGVLGGIAGKDGSNVLPTDTAIKNAIQDSTSQTAVALSASTAAQIATSGLAKATLARPGNILLPAGDSLTAGRAGDQFPLYAQLFSEGRLQVATNGGVPGERSDQILARLPALLSAWKPNVVTLLSGRNDMGQGVTFETWSANVKAMVALVVAAGAVPVLCTIPPIGSDSPAGSRLATVTWNAWLRDYAARIGAPLVDFYTLLVNPSSGGYLTAYAFSGDDIHPNGGGYAAMGQLLSDTIAPMTPARASLLPSDNFDAANRIRDGLFLENSAAPGVRADQTDPYGSGNTYTIDAADSTIKGSWQNSQITADGFSGFSMRFVNAFAPVVGHRYALVGRIKTSNMGTGGTVEVDLQRNGTTVAKPVPGITQPVARGRFYVEYVVPTGTTSLSVLVLHYGGAAKVGLAQVGLYDLDAMATRS